MEKYCAGCGGIRIVDADFSPLSVSERTHAKNHINNFGKLVDLKNAIFIMDRGYASNYDHFSYDESKLKEVIQRRGQRVDVVNDKAFDFNGDYELYYKTISDHIPIVIELKIN